MSTDVNTKGTNLKFSLSLIKENKFTGKTESLPLSPGVISYLSIEDNILDMGLKGTISIDNKHRLLDKLDSSASHSTYIDINIMDTESLNKQLGQKSISFLSLIEDGSSLSENIQNNRAVYKIEEVVSSLLKKSSLYSIDLFSNDDSDTITNHMKRIINTWQEKILTRGEGNILGEFIETPVTGDFISFRDNTNESLYDILSKMALSTNISGKLPILKIVSTENAGRRLTFKDLFTDDHADFLNAYISGNIESGRDYSSVYLEEFNIAPYTGKSGTLTTNNIEDYQILEADLDLARGKHWGDYQLDLTGEDLTETRVELLDFTSIVSSFESDDLKLRGPIYSNIPLLRKADKKLFTVARDNNKESDGVDILKNSVQNKTKRSFLCLGESIILNVPGKMYRKPGMFITINGDGPKFDKQPWFVVSVKHIFNGLDHTNEITAVRLTGNDQSYEVMYSDLYPLVLLAGDAVDTLGDIAEVVIPAVKEGLKKLVTGTTDFFGNVKKILTTK